VLKYHNIKEVKYHYGSEEQRWEEMSVFSCWEEKEDGDETSSQGKLQKEKERERGTEDD